jgi:putative transposase
MVYVTRKEAKSDVFSHIEILCCIRRQHGHDNGLSPVEFERRQSI